MSDTGEVVKGREWNFEKMGEGSAAHEELHGKTVGKEG